MTSYSHWLAGFIQEQCTTSRDKALGLQAAETRVIPQKSLHSKPSQRSHRIRDKKIDLIILVRHLHLKIHITHGKILNGSGWVIKGQISEESFLLSWVPYYLFLFLKFQFWDIINQAKAHGKYKIWVNGTCEMKSVNRNTKGVSALCEDI